MKEEAEEEVPINEVEEVESQISKNDVQVTEENIYPEVEEKLPQESKISKTLSERTTKTVIILILVQLFLLPLI